MVPVQGDGQVRRDEQVAVQYTRPIDHAAERARELSHWSQSLVGTPAGVGDRNDVVPAEDAAGDTAKFRQQIRLDAVELVHAQPQLAGEAGGSQIGENDFEMTCVVEPDAVGHNLVKAAAQLGGAAAEGEKKFGI